MKHYDQVFLGIRLDEERYLAGHSSEVLNDLLDPTATQPSGVSPVQEPSSDQQQDFETFSREVRRQVTEVNEKVGAAQDAADSTARQGEIAAARAALDQLRALADCHPSVELRRLDEVMALIELIERESG